MRNNTTNQLITVQKEHIKKQDEDLEALVGMTSQLKYQHQDISTEVRQ